MRENRRKKQIITEKTRGYKPAWSHTLWLLASYIVGSTWRNIHVRQSSENAIPKCNRWDHKWTNDCLFVKSHCLTETQDKPAKWIPCLRSTKSEGKQQGKDSTVSGRTLLGQWLNEIILLIPISVNAQCIPPYTMKFLQGTNIVFFTIECAIPQVLYQLPSVPHTLRLLTTSWESWTHRHAHRQGDHIPRSCANM